MNKFMMPVLLLAVLTVGVGQIGKEKVYACGLDNLSDCISGTTDAYAAGQQDATYDHTNNLEYHPVAACCHDQDWTDQFSQGYNAKWNAYQGQSQTANINVENSPGAVVNVGQTSNQGPQPVGCDNSCGCNGPCQGGCDNSCGGPGCDSSCGNPCNYGCSSGPYFHHFGYWHHWYFGGGAPYRHIGFVDP